MKTNKVFKNLKIDKRAYESVKISRMSDKKFLQLCIEDYNNRIRVDQIKLQHPYKYGLRKQIQRRSTLNHLLLNQAILERLNSIFKKLYKGNKTMNKISIS